MKQVVNNPFGIRDMSLAKNASAFFMLPHLGCGAGLWVLHHIPQPGPQIIFKTDIDIESFMPQYM